MPDPITPDASLDVDPHAPRQRTSTCDLPTSALRRVFGATSTDDVADESGRGRAVLRSVDYIGPSLDVAVKVAAGVWGDSDLTREQLALAKEFEDVVDWMGVHTSMEIGAVLVSLPMTVKVKDVTSMQREARMWCLAWTAPQLTVAELLEVVDHRRGLKIEGVIPSDASPMDRPRTVFVLDAPVTGDASPVHASPAPACIDPEPTHGPSLAADASAILIELEQLVLGLERQAITEHAEVDATGRTPTADLDKVACAYGRGVAYRLAADRVRAVVRRALR